MIVLYTGDVASNVTINTATELWAFALGINERYEFQVDATYIVSTGQEEGKRIRIFSTNEISVLVQKQDFQATSDRYVGATEVYEVRFYGYLFFPVSKPAGCTSSSYTSAYYSVVPQQETTRIAIYHGDEYIDAFVLNQYDTYTNSTTSVSVDYSSYRIITDAPVAVYSGCACVSYLVDGSYISSVPPLRHPLLHTTYSK